MKIARRSNSPRRQQARRQLDELFDRLAAGDGEIEQSDSGSSFSRELRAIRTVEQPQALDEAELHRRVRSFGSVDLSLRGATWHTTALRRVDRRPQVARWRSSRRMGVWLEPRRVKDLPPVVFRSLATVARRYRGYRSVAVET